MTKNNLGRRGFISFYSPQVTILTEESQGRNQEAGNEMETKEKYAASWLDPSDLFNLFSYTI